MTWADPVAAWADPVVTWDAPLTVVVDVPGSAHVNATTDDEPRDSAVLGVVRAGSATLNP